MNNDKERLEEIEKNLDPLGYGMGGHLISVNDINWLVGYAKEQVERVQELENVNRVLKKSSEGSERAKERLRTWIDELEIENERYREALEFYADEETYETKFATDTDEICDSFTLIELDEGKKARKALEGDLG